MLKKSGLDPADVLDMYALLKGSRASTSEVGKLEGLAGRPLQQSGKFDDCVLVLPDRSVRTTVGRFEGEAARLMLTDNRRIIIPSNALDHPDFIAFLVANKVFFVETIRGLSKASDHRKQVRIVLISSNNRARAEELFDGQSWSVIRRANREIERLGGHIIDDASTLRDFKIGADEQLVVLFHRSRDSKRNEEFLRDDACYIGCSTYKQSGIGGMLTIQDLDIADTIAALELTMKLREKNRSMTIREFVMDLRSTYDLRLRSRRNGEGAVLFAIIAGAVGGGSYLSVRAAIDTTTSTKEGVQSP